MTLRKTLLLLTAGWLCLGAAPAKAPKTARAPAPSASGAAPKAAQAPVNGQDPAGLIAVLDSLQAKAEVAHREGDSVFLTVTSPAEIFSVQFAACDQQGRACQAMLFDRLGQAAVPTQAQVNSFNQTSVMCRVYLDRTGKPHVEYSALLFPSTGRTELLMHINAWRGCIGDFSEFLKDPNGFLAQAA